ncbi:RloB family protein [Pedobacter alpinus]|uniref:RloB family protein n=1 Tax=Pedobacter alpinus TaxID=1590643 RepID=A0ABW5TTV1_9SPHI
MAISQSKEARYEAYLRSIAFVNNTAYVEEKIEQKKKFLIICEGKNTEPCYFEGFPVPSKSVIIERGCNTKNKLVDFAIKKSQEEENKDREVWCVFDYDIKPDEAATQPQDFNSSIDKAEQNGLKVAWSNDAFELWFVLHYQELESNITREELYDILKVKWQLVSFHNTAKTIEYCKGHYDRHNDFNGASQELAIRRAKKLHKQFGVDKNYAKHCPCTTVYQLVEELNRNKKK